MTDASATSVRARLVETIEVGDALGEGVLWRAEDSSVWWTDIQGRRLHRLSWPGLALETFETPERLASFAFLAEGGDAMVAAFETGFALFEPASGRLAWLTRPFELGSGVRLNDGRVDPAGRFWVGSMVEDDDGGGARGALYCLEIDGSAVVRRDGLTISNGLCWSPDGRRMHHADSAVGTMYVADYDPVIGEPENVRVFAETQSGAAPDGAVIDDTGVLWSAEWGAGRVSCFDSSGARLGDVEVPARQPTCPAFGGAERDLLFVTSARDGLSEARLAREPQAGHLFVFETDARGQSNVDAIVQSPAVDRFLKR